MSRIAEIGFRGDSTGGVGFVNEVHEPVGYSVVAREEIVVRRLRPENLVPILAWAYSAEKYGAKDSGRWEKERWDFQHPSQEGKKLWSPEVRKTHEVLQTILLWSSDSETRGHLDPPPGVPTRGKDGEIEYAIPDWSKPDEVDSAIAELARYYYNNGEYGKVTPLIAINGEEKPVGALTIRWRGDPFNPPGGRIAGIERLIVDPARRHQGIGRGLIVTAIELTFDKGYDGQGATEIRAWIMQDNLAGDWQANWKFFRGVGFQAAQIEAHWPEYAKKRNIPTKRGDATWFRLREDWYLQKKGEDPRIRPYDTIGD